MAEIYFVITLFLFVGMLSYIGIRYFSSERFQVLLVIPHRRLSDGRWLSLNITYYGLFNGIAYTLGALITTMLLLSIGLSFVQILTIVGLTLLICIPSSKIVATLIEHTKTGFTVGGAVFVGIFTAPVAIYITLYLTGGENNTKYLIIPILSAISIGYTLGEGVGRIGCLSFGCCYGKEVERISSALLKKVFLRWNTIFTGRLKKAAYASNLEGKKTVPVLSMGIIINNATSIIGIVLFIFDKYVAALLLTFIISQTYRFVSEFLRADYRGSGKISSYQKMAIANIIIAILYVFFWSSTHYPSTDLYNALIKFYDPVVIGMFALLFIFTTSYTGVSKVTYSITQLRLSSKVTTNNQLSTPE
jgi:hypothetical protein